MRNIKLSKYDENEVEYVQIGARIPTKLYNAIVELISHNQEELKGARNLNALINDALEYCLDNGIFSTSEREEWKPFGE